MTGKLNETRKFANHWTNPETASAEPRIWLGNISPSITHITGPQLTLKKMT